MEIITFLLLLSIVGIGLYKDMLWLTIIGVILLLAYLSGARTEKHVAPTGGPKIRPIIVKRRYEGPPSIYPPMMKIKVNPHWITDEWWERAFGAAGLFAGLVLTGFKPRHPRGG